MSNETEATICPDCMDEISEYGRYTHEESGDVVCAECYDNRETITCYHCSNTTTQAEIENGHDNGQVDNDGDWICGRHLTACAWCEELTGGDNITSVNGSNVCECCCENETNVCGDCENTYHNDDMVWSDSRDEYLCTDCAEAETDGVPSEYCPTCRTGNVHFDVLSERYVCTCAAMSLPFVRYRGGVRAVFYPTPAEEVMHVGQIG